MLTLLQVAVGTYCFMVPWAMRLNGLSGDFECSPERNGTAQMLVGKTSATEAVVSLNGAQWTAKILPSLYPEEGEED